MLKTSVLPFLLLCSACANADESDFLKPRNNQAFDNYMMQAARFETSLFKQDKPSITDAYFIGPTTPGEIRKTYEHNELAAKKKYLNHSIRIKAEIESISEDAFGNGYIVAVDNASRTSFMDGIHLQIDKNDPVYLQLGKGDKIDAICQVGSYILGTPSMSKCFLKSRLFKPESLENMAKSLTATTLLRAKNISTENIAKIKVNVLLTSFVNYASYYKNNEESNEAACRNDDASCNAAFLHDRGIKGNKFFDENIANYKVLGARLRVLSQQ